MNLSDAARSTMPRFSISALRTGLAQLLGVILVALSLWNVWVILKSGYHWPILTHDEWTEQFSGPLRMKSRLRERGFDMVGYRVVEPPETYSVVEFYALQNIMAPLALHLNSTNDPYVLVQFYTTKQVKPLPDLVLVEDLGDGFGLFHTPQ